MRLDTLFNLETKLRRLSSELLESKERLAAASLIASPHSDLIQEVLHEVDYLQSSLAECSKKIEEYRKARRKPVQSREKRVLLPYRMTRKTHQ